jgi:diacylglycerol kinase (ATP)
MMASFIERTRKRIVWSLAGLRDAWRSEPSFRSWVWVYLASLVLAVALPLTAGERALLFSLGGLVLAAELFNTAIERVVDLVTTKQHPLAGQAKDAGSAGVMVTALAAGVAWAVILLRLIW